MPNDRRTVLLVDDDPGDVLAFRDAVDVARLPISLHVVGDGDAALEFLRRRPSFVGAPRPDVVLLEPRLPRRDGASVLAALEADRHLRGLPVILFTAGDDDAGRGRCAVRKPSDLDGFLRVLRAVDALFGAAGRRLA